MAASVLAWMLAIVFLTSGLDKLISRQLRARFAAEVGRFLAPPWARPLGTAFVAAELAVFPLLLLVPNVGLWLLAALAGAVVVVALLRRPAPDEDCPCGGLWARSGRNLLRRNVVLLAAALYARWAAPVPLARGALGWSFLALLALLVVAGIVEGVRMRLNTR